MTDCFVVHDAAELGAGVRIAPFAVIGRAQLGNNVVVGQVVCVADDVIIGDTVVIHPGVVIYPGVRLGARTEIFPHAFLGKDPMGAGATSRSPELSRTTLIGENCSVGPNAVISDDVRVGNNTLIGDGASIPEKCSIGSYCILSRSVAVNYASSIWDRTKIMDNTHITGKATIGNNVSTSVMIGTEDDNVSRAEDEDERILGPHIEDDVVVDVGASFLPGVCVGKGATVAAGTVVTRDVEGSPMVAGGPARFVRNVLTKA